MTAPPPLRIAAALITRPDGRMLVVRKRDTTLFMQPGGKIEAGEAPRAALVRELGEELGLLVAPDSAAYLGRATAPAAFELGRIVEAELFHLAVAADVAPGAEIEAVAWIDPSATDAPPLAALTRDHVLPLYRSLSSGPVPA